MKTTVFRLDTDQVQNEIFIRKAAEFICDGKTVAFPTETVYGLGANGQDPKAVEKIFIAKNRPSWDPLILHVNSSEMLSCFTTDSPDIFLPIVKKFMPGPLSLILHKNSQVPDIMTAGLGTVVIRIPSHPIALALIKAAGVPIAAPSANLFGHVSPTTAVHVLVDLDGRIDLVLDGGETSVGVESTILDLTTTEPTVRRPGGVSVESLETFLGKKVLVATDQLDIIAPGISQKHYSPRTKLILSDGNKSSLIELTQQYIKKGKVGLVVPADWDIPETIRKQCIIYTCSKWREWEAIAHELYSGLRYLDSQMLDCIICPLPDNNGLGLALRDRLLRAAA